MGLKHESEKCLSVKEVPRPFAEDEKSHWVGRLEERKQFGADVPENPTEPLDQN